MDAYHTCYALAGLSCTQHDIYFIGDRVTGDAPTLTYPLQWTYSDHLPSVQGNPEQGIFEVEDRVRPIHPVYVIPWPAVEQTQLWIQQREGF